MTPQRFEEFVVNTLKDIQEILNAKNTEYSRSAEDRLRNFKRRAEEMEIDPLTVLQVDMFKHIDAINSYMIRMREGEPVKINDPINRRLNDTIIYCILAQALIEDLGLEDQLTEVGKKEHCKECSRSAELYLTIGCGNNTIAEQKECPLEQIEQRSYKR